MIQIQKLRKINVGVQFTKQLNYFVKNCKTIGNT